MIIDKGKIESARKWKLCIHCQDDNGEPIYEEIPLQIVKCLRDPNRIKKEPGAKKIKREVSNEPEPSPSSSNSAPNSASIYVKEEVCRLLNICPKAKSLATVIYFFLQPFSSRQEMDEAYDELNRQLSARKRMRMTDDVMKWHIQEMRAELRRQDLAQNGT